MQDLVLDIRFNSGGFLYIAQTAASMVTGPEKAGQVFEQVRFNDKRDAESRASVFRFSTTVTIGGNPFPRGFPLPRFRCPALYVLTSACLLGERSISNLRGIMFILLARPTAASVPFSSARTTATLPTSP